MVRAAATGVPTFAPGTTVTVGLKNAAGGLVPGKAVTLAAPGGHATVTPATVTTDATGKATFTVVDDTPERLTFTAHDVPDNVDVGQTSILFADHTVDPAQSTVSAEDEPAGSDNGATVHVTVRDPIGKPIEGRVVHLHSTNTQTTISPASVITDSNGNAAFTANDARVESVTYFANVEAGPGKIVTIAQRATVNYSTPVASLLQSSIDPLSQVVQFYLDPTITVTLRDGVGDPLAGRTVRLTYIYDDGTPNHLNIFDLPDFLMTVAPNPGTVVDGADLPINSGSATTNAGGAATFTLSSNNESPGQAFPRWFNLKVEVLNADGTVETQIGTAIVKMDVTYNNNP
jgi:hypothetical protein